GKWLPDDIDIPAYPPICRSFGKPVAQPNFLLGSPGCLPAEQGADETFLDIMKITF
ncbi:6642_t:CDS:2, partial [Acaulospora morrowiae]